MAKIITGPIVAEGRGKIGDIILNRNRGGAFARALKLTAAGAGAGDGASIYSSIPIELPDGVDVTLPFDTEFYDVGGLWALTPNPTRLTVTKAGVYLIIALAVSYVPTPTDVWGWVIRNQLDILVMQPLIPVGGNNSYFNMSCLVLLSVGDFIEFLFWQGSGAPGEIVALPFESPIFSIQQLTST